MRSLQRGQSSSLSTGNRLLDALPDTEFAQLLPQLTSVRLRHGQRLYEVGVTITHVYFPLTAVVSLMIELEDGRRIEMAGVGREGLAGLPVAMAAESDGHLAVTQIPGEALVLDASALRAALDALPGLRRIIARYSLVLLTQAGQSAACNSLHGLDERCARWLLEAHDRVLVDSFPLTQDYLANMLGVHRPSVTVAAGMLQQAGLITYHRGQVRILDRPRLYSRPGVSATTFSLVKPPACSVLSGEPRHSRPVLLLALHPARSGRAVPALLPGQRC
jgi:CRP-like cAMP-binding protein